MMTRPATARRAPLLVVCAASISLCLLLSPIVPAIDWPQHLALSAVLDRLWHGDVSAAETFAINPATHNAGAHFFVALLGHVIGYERAGAIFLALYPPLLLWGVARLLRKLSLPPWRALLLVPSVLGFSFSWGLGNFCMGTALSWLLLAPLLDQIERPTLKRAAALATGSLLVGATHVMAMLLLSLTAASLGIERVLRLGEGRPSARMLSKMVLAGAPLLAGCAWDLRVYFAHLAIDAASYSTPQVTGVYEPSLLWKAGLFGALLSGLFRSYTDTIIAWATVAIVLVMVGLAVRGRRATSSAARGHLALPALVLLLCYFLVPSVFANTHLVFQRIAQWVMCASVLAVPRLQERFEGRLSGVAAALAASYALVLLPAHLLVHGQTASDARAVLAAVPAGARVMGVIEDPSSRAIRMPVFTHVAALAVAQGAAEDGFSFARWMGLPVIYRPKKAPPYPEPSWEHDGRFYDATSPLARRFPWVLARSAQENEPDDALKSRLFGALASRVMMKKRVRGWALFDTTSLDPAQMTQR